MSDLYFLSVDIEISPLKLIWELGGTSSITPVIRKLSALSTRSDWPTGLASPKNFSETVLVSTILLGAINAV